jgi:hypothetical protein
VVHLVVCVFISRFFNAVVNSIDYTALMTGWLLNNAEGSSRAKLAVETEENHVKSVYIVAFEI